MTDCNRPAQNYEDDLKAYADGELPALRRFTVRRHLTHCASCREEITLMTQTAEDLRVSEPDAPLSRELREKILAAPGTGSAGLFGESRSATEESSVPEALSRPGSPAFPMLGRMSRKPLAWGLAAVALIAWLVVSPMLTMFQPVHEYARRTSADLAQTAPSADIKAFSGLKQTPEQLKAAMQTMSRAPDSEGAAALPSPSPGQPSDTTDLSQRQVHKEATIAVQVANPEDASDAIETQVKENGGFVVNNTLSTGDDTSKTAELIVKVPVTQFEGFLRQVAKLGIVQSKNITGEDITEQASDADQSESVLETDVQQSQARLNALGAKAKWRDEQAARDLRIQLAQAQARLVLLKRMATLSTVTIDLSQTPKPAVVPPVTGGFLTGLKDTTHDALQSLLSSGGALLALLIWLLAYAPLWIPAYFVGRYALKEYRKRQVV